MASLFIPSVYKESSRDSKFIYKLGLLKAVQTIREAYEIFITRLDSQD